MRVTQKQLLIMVEVLRDACRVHGGFAGFDHETLEKVYNQILNQQSDRVFDVTEEAQ